MGRPRKPLDLLQTFRAPRVLTLDQLRLRVPCSRLTVLRRLKEHGYYTSYNHSGRFVTIDEVADFDSRGLWIWKEARFSKDGTLKETVKRLLHESERGMTHEEFASILGVRLHNTLLNLVEEERICRERIGPTFVYLSPSRRVRREQAHRRLLFLKEREKLHPTSRQIIATLLELIRDPQARRPDIVRRSKRQGVALSLALVDTIFEKYELDKKRAP